MKPQSTHVFRVKRKKPEDWYEKMVRTTNDHKRSIRTMTEKISALFQKIDSEIAEKYKNQKRERRKNSNGTAVVPINPKKEGIRLAVSWFDCLLILKCTNRITDVYLP